jgi:hypothetical protein
MMPFDLVVTDSSTKALDTVELSSNKRLPLPSDTGKVSSEGYRGRG